MSHNLVQAEDRQVGSSSLRVGPLAYGCWRLVPPKVHNARELVEEALRNRMNLIDIADVYGLDWGGQHFGQAEETLGRVLAEKPSLREQMVLCGKSGIRPGYPYDSGEDYLVAAVEASLRRLRTDRLDLFLIHRPDIFTHPVDLAHSLDHLRSSGKVREVGVSNHTPAQVEALQDYLPFELAAVQPQFSCHHLAPLFDGTLDQCIRMNLLPMAWSPLAGGRLGDDAAPASGGPRPELLAALDALAERETASRSAVALAFVLCHPARPVAIVGSTHPERIAAARQALSVRLSKQDCYRLIEASMGAELP